MVQAAREVAQSSYIEFGKKALDWDIFQQKLQGFNLETFSDIEQAFNIARKAHEHQLRLSGEPYITHPIAVAGILIDLGIKDYEMICVALLHDVAEDTQYLKDHGQEKGSTVMFTFHPEVSKLARVFSPRVAEMVDQLTKVKSSAIEHLSEAQSDVLIIKMADRLHNLLTLGAMPEDKQTKIIAETKDKLIPIFETVLEDENYAKIAQRLLEEIKEAIKFWENR